MNRVVVITGYEIACARTRSTNCNAFGPADDILVGVPNCDGKGGVFNWHSTGDVGTDKVALHKVTRRTASEGNACAQSFI